MSAGAPSVSFVTMGCAKNEVDSAHMADRLAAAGYTVQDDPETADVVVVNTCSFIQAATEESIDAILQVAGFESVASGRAHLVVAGCMPARYGADLETELPEAGAFVPCADERNIVDVVNAVLAGPKGLPGESAGAVPAGSSRQTGTSGSSSPLLSGRVSAYVKISDGCDRFCSYCTIPYIRGRYRSFPEQDIMAEVGALVQSGVREVVLIAQDTGRWGDDLEEPSTLAQLLGHLARRWPETWFRVMYIQPEGVTDEFLQVMASHDNICNYLDIPFQHSNGDILRAMNRSGCADAHRALIAKARAAVPGVTVRTTLIAGFPGEGPEEFDELCAFVEEADLDYVGVFPYSREEGTRAHDLEGQVPEDEKMQRAQELRDLADAVCTPRLAAHVGSRLRVLVCGAEEDGQLYGRAACQAPDVDGVTFLDAGQPGDFVTALIQDTLFYEMVGEVVA